MKNIVSAEVRRLNYAVCETGEVYHTLYRAAGLSDSAGMILYVLLENGGKCLLREIRHFTGMGKQTMNSALRKLESDGIIKMESHSGERNKSAAFTSAGKKYAVKTVGKIIKMENKIFSSWNKSDVESYLALYELYLQSLRKKAEEFTSKNEHN